MDGIKDRGTEGKNHPVMHDMKWRHVMTTAISMTRFGLRTVAWLEGGAAKLERAGGWAAALLLACYGAVAVYCAHRKLFWFDELFSVYLSRTPDAVGWWQVPGDGADFNPPLMYWLMRLAESTVGAGHVGARLPEILGFGLLCLSLFVFVRRSASTLGGLVAMLVPMCSGALWYSFEARPHGLLMGACGAALVCWQAAARRTRPVETLWLLGLALSLAGGLLMHAYAVLLFVPLCLGEAWRVVVRRRLDLPMALALLAGSAPMILLMRLAQAVGQTTPPEWPAPGLATVAASYLAVLTPEAMVLAACALLATWVSARGPDAPRTAVSVRGHEMAVLVGLLALPILALGVAKLTAGPLFSRYSLSAVAGWAALVGLAVAGRPRVAALVAAALLAQFVVGAIVFMRSPVLIEPSSILKLSTYRPHFDRRYEFMTADAPEQVPIVVLDNLDYLPTAEYAPAHLASRLVFLLHPHDIGSQGLVKLKACCNAPINPQPVDDFLKHHPHFLVYSTMRSASSMNALLARGLKARVLRTGRDALLFEVGGSASQ